MHGTSLATSAIHPHAMALIEKAAFVGFESISYVTQGQLNTAPYNDESVNELLNKLVREKIISDDVSSEIATAKNHEIHEHSYSLIQGYAEKFNRPNKLGVFVEGQDAQVVKHVVSNNKAFISLSSPNLISTVWDKTCNDKNIRYKIVQSINNAAMHKSDDVIQLQKDLQAAVFVGDLPKLKLAVKYGVSNFFHFNSMFQCTIQPLNNIWMNRILDLSTQKNNIFFIIGAGHFANETSMLDLLEANGFKLERIYQN